MNGSVEVSAVACTTWNPPIEADLQQAHPLPGERTCLGTIVVNLPERVTWGQTRMLLCDLKRELKVDRPNVVLDLSEVKEMDTAGLDLLAECVRETVRRDGTLCIRAVSPEAATVLELTGMDRILEGFARFPGQGANHPVAEQTFASVTKQEAAA